MIREPYDKQNKDPSYERVDAERGGPSPDVPLLPTSTSIRCTTTRTTSTNTIDAITTTTHTTTIRKYVTYSRSRSQIP